MADRSQTSKAGRSLVQCRYRKERLIANGRWAGMTARQRVCKSGRRAGQSVKRAVRPANGQPVNGQTASESNRRWRNENRSRLVPPTGPDGNPRPYNRGRAQNSGPERRAQHNETTRNAARQVIDPNDERGNARGYYIGDVFYEDDNDTDVDDNPIDAYELNFDNLGPDGLNDENDMDMEFDEVPFDVPEINMAPEPYLNQPGNANNMGGVINDDYNMDEDEMNYDNFLND